MLNEWSDREPDPPGPGFYRPWMLYVTVAVSTVLLYWALRVGIL